MTEIRIEKIKINVLDELVNIHSAALPEDVLPSMGKTLLINYYKNAITDPSQLIIGGWSDGNLLGFCLISQKHLGLLNIFMSIHGIYCMLATMLLRPRLFYSGLIQSMKSLSLKKNTAEIAFIAVLPSHHGNGIGKLILDYGIQICRESNVEFVQTKTSNKKLRNYYVKKYFAEEIDNFVISGTEYSVLKWSIKLPCYK